MCGYGVKMNAWERWSVKLTLDYLDSPEMLVVLGQTLACLLSSVDDFRIRHQREESAH
jgi:hypothetical protein